MMYLVRSVLKMIKYYYYLQILRKISGNLKVSGKIVYPSDARAKHNIEELDTAQQLRNVQSIRVVK